MLQVPVLIACEFLIGKIGASSTVSQDLKNKQFFSKTFVSGKGKLTFERNSI